MNVCRSLPHDAARRHVTGQARGVSHRLGTSTRSATAFRCFAGPRGVLGTGMGQGLTRKAAEVFGARYERVKNSATETGNVTNTSATPASSGSDLNGTAVKAACDENRALLAPTAVEAGEREAHTA